MSLGSSVGANGGGSERSRRRCWSARYGWWSLLVHPCRCTRLFSFSVSYAHLLSEDADAGPGLERCENCLKRKWGQQGPICL